MKVLLDTHVWIWWLLGSDRLAPPERRSLDQGATDVGSALRGLVASGVRPGAGSLRQLIDQRLEAYLADGDPGIDAEAVLDAIEQSL